MKRLGLRVEIVLNIVFITAVAMFLVGIVALKVTERVVLQGKVEGAKSIVTAVESLYIGEDGLKNLKNETYFSKGILESGGWMTLTDGENRVIFSIGSKHDKGKFLFDPLLQSTLRSGETSLEVDRKSFPPFTFYRGFKMASSLMKNGRPTGGVLLYMPLDSLERELLSLGKLISIYILLALGSGQPLFEPYCQRTG